ncbi:MAG: DUF255 domain-containing protein [Rhizobiales bacterium]|nr:DUF255 domain-containing protein [Hyphomicrobiales bacterium]
MSRNFLAQEVSPYLQQHKDNPVHWYPWGETALGEARRQGKPILLSVGYAACHWCHVMAHESFEDDEVAAVMNANFINIKVDREERPDIDAIYMSALHMLGEQGGWPLTMFLTPDGEPFWGGTYFPKEPKFGRPGFIQLMTEIARLFREEPQKIETNRAALAKGLLTEAATSRAGEPHPAMLDLAAEKFQSLMDPVNGGIQGAPKFPQTGILNVLWRHALRRKDQTSKDAVIKALNHMCQGGIYDHLGGGFSRYSTDARWLAPHFEKMLYDNALLIDLMTSVWQETKSPLYAARIRETIDWLAREMMTPDTTGAFAASLDADSEGEEGKFYVWQAWEISTLLGPDAVPFNAAYDVSAEGNWEEKNILNRIAQADEPWRESEEAMLRPLRERLLAERSKRIRPGFDDKILTDWNGLMIAALARAGLAFGNTGWIERAVGAYRFILKTMRQEGRLFHAWRAGHLQHRAMVDDLANMISASLALHEATQAPSYLDDATDFANELEAHYRDAEHGGYFYTADDAPGLIVRRRTVNDDATPAANGTLPGLFTTLAFVSGNMEWMARADALLRSFGGEIERNLFPLGSYLCSLEKRLRPIQIVLIGEETACHELRQAVLSLSLPDRILTEIADGATLPAAHPAHGKQAMDGRPTAYVCVGEVCSLPVTDGLSLASALSDARSLSVS